jgi:hypothetical protein
VPGIAWTKVLHGIVTSRAAITSMAPSPNPEIDTWSTTTLDVFPGAGAVKPSIVMFPPRVTSLRFIVPPASNTMQRLAYEERVAQASGS